MLVAAAVCPHPPSLPPRVAGGAAADLAELRAACDTVVGVLLDAAPTRIVLVGDGPRTQHFSAGAVGELTGYGVDLRVRLGEWRADGVSPGGAGPGEAATLPLSLTMGAWLLARAADRLVGRGYAAQAVDAATTSKDCAALGARLVAGGDPVAMLVLGDGSACRGEGSPGPADPRAIGFDAAAAQSLATADLSGLLALSRSVASDVLAAGRASWQVLAGAAHGRDLHGSSYYHDAPFGVAYHVVSWR